YPVDVDVDPRAPQNRWKTGFRLILVIPAAFVSGGIGTTLFVAAFLGWGVCMFTGRMPRNLHRAQLLALRYSVQVNRYINLLTDRYPYASPAPPLSEPPALEAPAPVA